MNIRDLINQLDLALINWSSEDNIFLIKKNIADNILNYINIKENINNTDILNEKAAFLEQEIHFSMDILHSHKLNNIKQKISKTSFENIIQFDDLVDYPHIEEYKNIFNMVHILSVKKEISVWQYINFKNDLDILVKIDITKDPFYWISDKYFDIILWLYHNFEDTTNIDNKKEMLGYQPTPIKILQQILNNIPLSSDDIFYDIWSGFWRTGFFCEIYGWLKNKSVEYNEEHCSFWNWIINRLNLEKSHIINKDAKEVDYSDGTIFYIFNSFVGDLFDNVMNKLAHIAKQKKIIVCGFYTPKIHELDWLKCIYIKPDGEWNTNWIYIYESL